MKLYKFFTAVGVLALAAGFTSCSDDDEAYTPGFEGVDGQVVLAPTNNDSYKIVKIPTGDVKLPDITWNVAPRSRVRAGEELTVKFAIDNSLIDVYNAENETEYMALPDGLVSLVDDEPTIAVGNTSSDVPVSFAIKNDAQLISQLKVGSSYLLPIRLASVIKGSARIAVSASNVSYVSFTVSEEMLNMNGSPTGTVVPASQRSGWSAIVGGNASENDTSWYAAINQTGGYTNGYYYDGGYVQVDLGKMYKFDGICCYGFYNQLDYSLFQTGTTFEISSDGNAWTNLGSLPFGNQVVAFYAPVEARYIKMTAHPSNYIWVAATNFSIYAL